jgi:hypothetical protein
MTPDAVPCTPNVLKERNPDEFKGVEEFRALFEEMLLARLEDVLCNPRFRDRGHFLPRDDVRAIAQVLHVLTRKSWTKDDLDRFDASWRDAMRSDLFAEAFESVRHRIQNAVHAGRESLAEQHGARDVTQGTLW